MNHPVTLVSNSYNLTAIARVQLKLVLIAVSWPSPGMAKLRSVYRKSWLFSDEFECLLVILQGIKTELNKVVDSGVHCYKITSMLFFPSISPPIVDLDTRYTEHFINFFCG